MVYAAGNVCQDMQKRKLASLNTYMSIAEITLVCELTIHNVCESSLSCFGFIQI